MTRKYTLFGLSEAGQLVYRKTGALVKRAYTYVGTYVYDLKGRLIGRIGKGTTKQQSKMKRASERRKKTGRDEPSPAKPSVYKPNGSSARTSAPRAKDESTDFLESDFIDYDDPIQSVRNVSTFSRESATLSKIGQRMTRDELNLSNFARYLEDAYDAGYLTADEVNDYYKRMQNSTDKADKTDLWFEVKYEMRLRGYIDSG